MKKPMVWTVLVVLACVSCSEKTEVPTEERSTEEAEAAQIATGEKPAEQGALTDIGKDEEKEKLNEYTAIDWPPDSGYANRTTNVPSQPPNVEPTITDVTITQVSGNQYLFTHGSTIEIRSGVKLFIHPGATITYLCDDPVRHTLSDYNGNPCTLVRGLTVIVNEYGEFVPVKYLPIR